MKSMLWFSVGLVACNAKGSVVVDPEGNIVEDLDTAVVDTAIADSPDGTDTNTEEPSDEPSDTDTQTDTDTSDTQTETDTDTPVDTDEPVDLPNDVNNPSVYPNYWDGQRVISYQGCSETILEFGVEVTADYPNWLSLCDCDEIYQVQISQSYVCGVPLNTAFYRGIKYNGQEIEIRYWPGNPSTPTEASLLAVGNWYTNSAGQEVWVYDYAVEWQGDVIQLDGQVAFSE